MVKSLQYEETIFDLVSYNKFDYYQICNVKGIHSDQMQIICKDFSESGFSETLFQVKLWEEEKLVWKDCQMLSSPSLITDITP